ncbi:MAG: hypothetical protein M1341_05445 [Candidatus Thermoplasmatota archaeon]|nr:hypothetical protein [Candidatus Thermoplasmatota archaeon]
MPKVKFAHSLESDIFNGVWDYTQCRLMHMHRWQHNRPGTWKNADIMNPGLSIMETKPSTFLEELHNSVP